MPNETGLYVVFLSPVGSFLWLLGADTQVEEWKSGIISHQEAEGGVKIGPILRDGPASKLRGGVGGHRKRTVIG